MNTVVDEFSTDGFGIENLPYGSFSTNSGDSYQLGARLGDYVIDLAALAKHSSNLSEPATAAVNSPNLDVLLSTNSKTWSEVRTWLKQALLNLNSSSEFNEIAYPINAVTFQLAFTPQDYVDFYASEHHATNLGRMFRPDEDPLKPNWKHLPVGYHGRSGTVVVSGTPIKRPKGLRPEPDSLPSFGPSRRLDIEAEIGFVLGFSAPDGEVSVKQAANDHIFGVFLFNDWSARDIQNYEYVPLGPNLGKSFASTVGTWIVPWEALDQAFVSAPERDFPIAEYLKDDETVGGPYGLDIKMSVQVNGELVSEPPFALMYWTAPQMVAHMTVNGGSLRPGDMFGSGTVSGFEKNQRGSFIELSWGGKEPLRLVGGREMTFLEDGMTIALGATAPGNNGEIINFGDCFGTIVAATPGEA